jgi:hypothetical protein
MGNELLVFTEVSEVLKRLMTAGVVDCFRVADPLDYHLQNYPPRAAGSLTPIPKELTPIFSEN